MKPITSEEASERLNRLFETESYNSKAFELLIVSIGITILKSLEEKKKGE